MKRRSDPINHNENKSMRLLRRPAFAGLLAMTRSQCAIIILALGVSSSATIINIPADYPTIQAGIAYSNDGDTVLVQPGLYYEIIDFFGHNVTVGSLFLTTGDTSYVSSTIIDGVGAGPVITFQSGEDSSAVLTGFTVRNGYFDNGGGIRCMFGSSPTIKRNVIADNIGYRNCGGIYCLNSSNPRIEDNRIENNSTGFYGGGVYCIRSAPVIKNNIIRLNYAFRGGGIYIDDCRGLIISGNIIHRNIGGGIDCGRSDVILVNNDICFNDQASDGGAIYFDECDALIIGNIVSYNNCRYSGGGIYLRISYAKLLNNIITGNYAKYHGGAIYITES